MKKALIVLTVLLSLFAGVATAATNSGTAVIPFYHASIDPDGNVYQTNISLSNITDKNINVEVILYKKDGTILTDTDNNPYGGTIRGFDLLNYYDNFSDKTLSFTLGPNSSGRFDIYNLEPIEISGIYGYGIIKWTQDSTAVNGLVASGIGYYQINDNIVSLGYSQLAIPINDGLPF